MAFGIECVQCAGPTPGGGERRACGVVAGNHLENMIRVGGARDLPHPILPAKPPRSVCATGDDYRYIRLDIDVLGRLLSVPAIERDARSACWSTRYAPFSRVFATARQ